MENSEELEKLKSIISEVLSVEESEITSDTRFVDDLGADSLDLYQIILGIEEEFDITIPEGSMEGISTVADAAAQIREAKA